MQAEMAEAAGVFARAVMQEVPAQQPPKAIYTFARGSSDTVANILSYEAMTLLGIPMTSLPPSVFSLGHGVGMDGAIALIISQSGASADLVACAKGAGTCGARTWSIVNVEGSEVAAASELFIPVCAGPERAVPATKTVIGSIGAGMAMLAALDPSYRAACTTAAAAFDAPKGSLPQADALSSAFLAAQHVYVIGRQASYGAAQEIALKLKETCALHAEAYSASEVLHGPLELVTKPLTVLLLDAGDEGSQPSLNTAEAQFRKHGATVFRVSTAAAGWPAMAGPAQAAALLSMLYPVVHQTALALGLDPDAPQTLMKVTSTR